MYNPSVSSNLTSSAIQYFAGSVNEVFPLKCHWTGTRGWKSTEVLGVDVESWSRSIAEIEKCFFGY